MMVTTGSTTSVTQGMHIGLRFKDAQPAPVLQRKHQVLIA